MWCVNCVYCTSWSMLFCSLCIRVFVCVFICVYERKALLLVDKTQQDYSTSTSPRATLITSLHIDTTFSKTLNLSEIYYRINLTTMLAFKHFIITHVKYRWGPRFGLMVTWLPKWKFKIMFKYGTIVFELKWLDFTFSTVFSHKQPQGPWKEFEM